MTTVYFMGDLHLGHRNICKYREFGDVQQHRDYLHDRYHQVVTKRDVVYFLGDICFTPEALQDLSGWVGRKVLILGNHDTQSGTASITELAEVFTGGIHSLLRYKEFWLSHAPLHTLELRGKSNIHGHVHGSTIPDARYINASVENLNYRPVSLKEVRTAIHSRRATGMTRKLTDIGCEFGW